MNYLKQSIILLFVFSATSSIAQSSGYDRLGMQAMMKGDYKGAVGQLEKADTKSPNDAGILKMLGYSYFQCGRYEKSIATYSRLIALKPADYSAYYYRGKARLNVANEPGESLNQMRGEFYLSAIKDLTKAIEINGEEDPALLQNRGIAYKDYAIFKSYKIKKSVEKKACVALFDSALADFEKILLLQPQRADIVSMIKYVKAQVASLK